MTTGLVIAGIIILFLFPLLLLEIDPYHRIIFLVGWTRDRMSDTWNLILLLIPWDIAKHYYISKYPISWFKEKLTFAILLVAVSLVPPVVNLVKQVGGLVAFET